MRLLTGARHSAPRVCTSVLFILQSNHNVARAGTRRAFVCVACKLVVGRGRASLAAALLSQIPELVSTVQLHNLGTNNNIMKSTKVRNLGELRLRDTAY